MIQKKNSAKKDNLNIFGASENNLRAVDISLPKGKFVVITGPSGSGKSSLAFNVIYQEGQRRYLEGLSAYARSYLDIASKPNVEKIENLSPTIAIDQKSIARSPRSTVGTLTEIYDYLRVLFSKVGEVYCSQCQKMLVKKSLHEILAFISQLPNKTEVCIIAQISIQKGSGVETVEQLRRSGYRSIRVPGGVFQSLQNFDYTQYRSASLELLVDRMNIAKKSLDKERILDSLEEAFKHGVELMLEYKNEIRVFQKDYYCHDCQKGMVDITPRDFSFNNPEGACETCSGLGVRLEFDPKLLVLNGALTLEEGAINILSRFIGKSRSKNSFWNFLENFARKNKINLKKPVNLLTEKQRQLLWYGDSQEKQKSSFQGIIGFLEKKHLHSTSEHLRKELEKYMHQEVCSKCQGRRLKKESLSVLVQDKNIMEWSELSLDRMADRLKALQRTAQEQGLLKKTIQQDIIQEIRVRIEVLLRIGLGYLTLDRTSQTLSGGEGQRIRLAVQLISELSGVIYILDEPSMGLHGRDTKKLIATLQQLKDSGNSVFVVEHDRDIMQAAEWLVDIGPGAGEEGGKVIFSGPYKKLVRSKCLTAQYLSGKKKIQRKKNAVLENTSLTIYGAKEHNLKNVTVKFPLNSFVVVTGVSGSGKSTLVSDILLKALKKHFYDAKSAPGKHEKITGAKHIDKVIGVNQDPIGRTSRSNVATYTGIFSLIRDVFSQTSEAQSKKFDASRFSFNLKGGRCEACQGEGLKKIEMYLMPDMFVNCDICNGTRYNAKTLEIEYHGVNIAQVLDMSVSYAKEFFQKHGIIKRKLEVLERVGLGYLKLGQGAPNLSGGEAQRIKLATELGRKSTGKTLYILDEPTIGLHFDDVQKLMNVLDDLIQKGNSVVMVEHNNEVIRSCDWVIDLGPEGGSAGGKVVFSGTSKELKKCKKSWTGKYL